MSDRRESLLKNTALFALGNLGSKMLQIFLVPYYTRVLASGEFGVADILQAIVSLLMPVFSLTIYESVFRFAMEKNYDRKSVFSTGLLVSIVGAVVLCLTGVVTMFFVPAKYVWLVVGNTVAVMFRSLLSQYARAINRIGLFTFDNILHTALVLVLNIYFITVLDWGVPGYMLGYIVANIISAIVLAIVLGGASRFSAAALDGFLMQDMLLFSAPLIPNTICWWISNFIDRVIITAELGGAANGIYAAAHKIPSLLTVIVTVFFQAWQISANTEFKKKDISKFYTEIHDQVFASILLISSVLILLCRPIADVFLGAEYAAAWQSMPILLVAMTFFALAQFLGSIYSANMRTGKALITNAIAVGINLVLNLILIKRMNVLGAGIATACSYFVLWIVRAFDTRRIVAIRYRVIPTVLGVGVLIAQMVLVTLDIYPVVTYGACAVGTLAILLIFRKSYIGLLRFVAHLIRKVAGKGG